MIGADRIAADALRDLERAMANGEPLEPSILRAHKAFAKSSAERWFVHAARLPNALAERDRSLAELLQAVGDLNRSSFPQLNESFDEECRTAVRSAFAERLSELEAGWRR